MIKLISTYGLHESLLAVRLPMQDIKADNISMSSLSEEFDKRINLLSRLVKAGTEHAKAVRGIWVTLAITWPRYMWSEMDTYTIGRQPLSSTSTMHKITSRDLIPSDFEDGIILDSVLSQLNYIRNKDISVKDKILHMKRILPESYLQTRIIQFNYQTLRNIYFQRKNHKLENWHDFCKFIETLDYSQELIIKT